MLDALCTLLEIDGVRFGAIESEQFSRGNPWLALTEWLPQLAAVVALQREAGRDMFLVAATAEGADELRALSGALGTPGQLVVCLQVPPELAAKRVAAREPDAWPGKAALVEHARDLAERIPTLPGIDRVISTVERAATDVAREIRQVLIDRRIVFGGDG